MSDEFDNINSRMPDLGSVLAQRILAKKAESTGNLPPPGTVDPYQLMLQKNRPQEVGEIDPKTIVKWPEEDTKKLQDYCAKMGIVGFNCGRMHPIAALSMLRKQFGDDFTDVPLENRVPAGYQKLGTKSDNNSNYPYSSRVGVSNKQILHG